jgi:hypothetical protein
MTSPLRPRPQCKRWFRRALKGSLSVAVLAAVGVAARAVADPSDSSNSGDAERVARLAPHTAVVATTQRDLDGSRQDLDHESGVDGGVDGGDDAVGRIAGLDNVETSVFALGSVWAVTSSRPDVYARLPLESTVIRIDPTTRTVDRVLDAPRTAPTFSELDGRLWLNLSDRIVALDPSGSEVASIPFESGKPGDHVAGDHHLWVLDPAAATVSVIEPETAEIVRTIETGASPVHPIAAFGHVWIPSITDGTVTIIDETTLGSTTRIEPFVSSEWLTDVTAVPNGLTGDEVWVTNIKGEIFAITAEGDAFGQIRHLDIDTSINLIYVHDRLVFLLPVFGLDVLVLDRQTEVLVTRIRTQSIPFRATVAHDLVWVAGDGPRETLTVIDPETLGVRNEFSVGANESNTTGPQRPLEVDDEVWVPNRGDDAFFIVNVNEA